MTEPIAYEDLIDWNRTIVEFLEWQQSPDVKRMYKDPQYPMANYRGLDEMLFHMDWSWHMPVWSKVCYSLAQLLRDETVDDNEVVTITTLQYSAFDCNDIQAAYKNLVAAINFINSIQIKGQ